MRTATWAAKGLMGVAVCILAFGCPSGASGATYVVDQANPAADDKNPGTEEKPFGTIQRAADAAKAGDTVCVMEGNYPERVKLPASGTGEKWITFTAFPTRRVLMNGFDTNGASYIRIQGFDISNPDRFYGKSEGLYEGGIQITSQHLEATDNFIHDLGCAVHGDKGGDIRLAYNRFYKCQQQLLILGENWTVENNEISRVIQYTKSDGDYCRGWGKGHVLRYNRFHGTHKFVKPGEENEVPTAHLDCFQTWALKPYHLLQDFTFEDNMCEVFSQGAMIERATEMDPNALARLTFRRNIYWHGGAYGLCLGHITGVTVENNTFAQIKLFGVGMKTCTGQRVNNLYVDVRPEQWKPWWDDGNKETHLDDPGVVDRKNGNFRLKKGSPLIGAGAGGGTPGALEYPNVYYVDPRHPGADDEGFGYPGWPYKTAAKALATAESGETVILRGGVYRETLKPAKDGVTIRAMKGETVVVSGADLVEGWKRQAAGWSAPLAARPTRLLRDGKPWSEFTYDEAAKALSVKTGGDPRLHVWETVVRKQAVDLSGRTGVKVEGVEVRDTLEGPAAPGR